ncbi:T9SS type A sorting domain-containing protein [Epilithonimonas sp.]|uniref:T9SS type A sorting domain-containing protein n=1 Tax=Epilithonimonas sp. TaxID=2894511 RepID=UPI002FDE03E7
MPEKIYSLKIFKSVFFAISTICSIPAIAQVVPENTRFVQLNTLKGSRLSLIESTDNFVYHVGTINSSEVGLDNLSATNVGLDDLFILKSTASIGTNSWFKTFNAGVAGKISPKTIFVDANENVYVFAQFQGSVKVGNKTITSSAATDSFLMKIDALGTAQWISYLPEGNSTYNNTIPKSKCITSGTDTFLIYGGNHLLRLNNANGEVIYNNIYDNVELKSLAVNGQDLYIAGATMTEGVNFQNEFIDERFVGFIVKGDKEGNFNASLRTSQNISFQSYSDISDIALSGDGSLLVTGFYTRNAVNLITETSSYTFTYNPNDSYNNINRLYNYVAKVDLNLGAVSFYRSSSAINQEGIYNIRTDLSSSKLIPYGNTGSFRQINYITTRTSTITEYTNPNGTSTSLTPLSGTQTYSALLSYNNLGAYSSGAQFTKYGFKISASGNGYTTTENSNIRVFKTSQHNAENDAIFWTKEKTNSIGGNFSKQFQKHLNSVKSDIFFTALAEGKGQFFNSQFDNGQNVFSRYISRLGADGTVKWTAKFESSGTSNLENVSQNFATTDKDDNFYVLCDKPSQNSNFIDGTGAIISFTKNFMDGKVLIKLNKDGQYIWGKEIGNTNYTALITDSSNNIYVTGSTGNLYLDGQSYNGTTNAMHILKFDTTGNLVYGKFLPNNITYYSITPILDAQSNLYIFTEPSNSSGLDYTFGNITVPTNESHTDLLMLKFDNIGNAVFGKNFFANSSDYKYAWSNDVAFDGQDFIMMGNILGDVNDPTYTGLNLVNIPKKYPSSTYSPFLAKIKTDGTAIWQKVLESNNSNAGNYTNIALDDNKNIYMYYSVKDKVDISGTEYSFDSVNGNKIFIKLNTSGELVYYRTVDKGMFAYSLVDVIDNDKINLSGFSHENNFLNYKINNNNATNLYVATFGTLDQKYLTPQSNYSLLSNTSISNNPANANSFEFDLVNNVNWIATSDQTWLGLSFSKVAEGKNSVNTISGYGDAKIILTAETNNSGVDRSANVLLNSDGGVASKTVVVTQSRVLGTQESKTFVTVIYPNPTSDILNIQTEQKISKIEIYDTTGKLLKSNSKETNINVSELIKGMYLIKIYTDQSIINSKFIKN